MDLFVVALLAVVDIIVFIRYKRIYNPTFMLITFWIVILFFGHFRLLGEDESDVFTYFVIIVGLLSFAIGGLLAKNNKRLKISFGSSYKVSKPEVTETIAYRSRHSKVGIRIVFGFAVLYSAYNMINLAPLILSGRSIGDIRQMYLIMGSSDSINSGPIAYFVQNILFQTCQTSCVVIGCTEYLLNKKWRYLLPALFTVLVSGLTYGNRIVFVDIILYVAIGYIILNEKTSKVRRKLSKRQKRMIIVGAVAAVGILIYITNVRQGKGSFWMALYNDYTCCIRLLDISIQRALEEKDITWGVVSITGLIEPITAVLGSSLFGNLLPTPEAYMTLAKYTNEFIDIGSGQYNNAYVSAFFYFYLDGRMIAVILFSGACGYAANLIYNRIRSKVYLPKDFCLFLFLVSVIFRSMVRFQPAVPSCFWTFVLISILYRTEIVNPNRVKEKK